MESMRRNLTNPCESCGGEESFQTMSVNVAKDFQSLVYMLFANVVLHVWGGSSINLQKYSNDQHDIFQIFENLLERLSTAEFELFLIRAWFIWNQRNAVVHGEQIKTGGG